ncbi:tetratricopeptide repeat protein [Rickettsiales endosymbiont of Peranema trichophorum]|uniref:tetratricopeptide repeat protein n=1 Tax=Rickettsiales endosymbiont of Peranema trichophorum TaxID=2486577 RepID=UPI001A90FD1F|nr:tetratricopeptide repeat protein [Rickettsiales endosymbiont of Peranema trichophorum]
MVTRSKNTVCCFVYILALSMMYTPVLRADDVGSLGAIPHNERDASEFVDAELASRMGRLEQAVISMQKRMYNSNVNGSAGVDYDMVVEIEHIHTQLKEIRGILERIEFEKMQLKAQFDKFTADVEYRLSEITKVKSQENTSDIRTGSDISSTDTSNTKKQEQIAPRTAEEDYKAAVSLYKDKKEAQAAVSLENFVNKHEKSKLLIDVYFLLGEIYTKQGKYEKAGANYAKGYKAQPKSAKAPEHLYKLGQCLVHLNKKEQACITFAKLLEEFPAISSDFKKKLNKEIGVLNCSKKN